MNKHLNQFFVELEQDIDPKIQQNGAYVRYSFVVDKKISEANLIMSALGVYVGYLNGERLGEQQLTPGYTDYRYRVQYQEYDVTANILQGENVLGAVVGDGWYRGCIDIGSVRNAYGTKTKFLCYLELHFEDGTKETITTNENWSVSQSGALRENNLKTIERYDASKELIGWNIPGYDMVKGQWHRAYLAPYNGQIIPQQGELILEHEHFTPQVLHTPDGNVVLDMRQNFAGYVRFHVTGEAGTSVSLTMGEVLDENGNFTMKNLVAEGSGSISGEVGQKLEYVLKDGNQTFQPLFLNSGFRYVLLKNWPEEVIAENFEGIAVYSDITMKGHFHCSNELINQLVRNVRWSLKSNFVDIPGDCPTRERSGWTADISVFAETACYLSDSRKFLKKWLQDYKYEQSDDGNFPYVVPCAGKPMRQRGCLGWSNAIANISIELYQFYGKKEDLQDVYDSVKRFIDFNVERAKKKNPFFLFKCGKHRKYIVETGFHYGEWLEPGRPMYKDVLKDLFFPDTEVTTAWFYTTVMQFVTMAKILGKTQDIEKYEVLSEKLYQAYHKEFLKKGMVYSKRHCRYVRPIAHQLVSGEQKEKICAKLNSLCKENDYKIGTGFLTTWQVLKVLTECGYSETAYKLLENTKQPGWLFAVTKGATTTWESWNGIVGNGVPVDSHNHFAPGAVVAWLFAYCAGIQPAQPGFQKIRIAPVPGGSLKNASCSYESIQGMIRSDWEIKDQRFILDVRIPEGIPAEIILPNGKIKEVTGGYHRLECEYQS
ncbi:MULTISPECIES: family 78 glycoside hydrolase catalytic domain [Clostridia]|uniref:family 78 glycoside hydrolase catalytic domain n=1 Tax=Clostridia TaxID=186801 RepID=UPI00067F1DE1|nr:MULTISPECIES: family 78 glycoside hydrolase catalytic domain [Clostridia]